MSAAPIRVGIIGLGAIGQMVLKDFLATPETSVRIVCDIDGDRAASTAAQVPGATWSTDFHTMLAGDHVDLVYVAVPPRDHHRIVLDVLQAGKHVLCEKPLALTLDEAREMLARAQAAGVIHALHLPLVYFPGMQAFGAQVAAGFLGDLRRIEIALVFPHWPRAWQQNAWVGTREQGGPIREVTPHDIGAILRHFGAIARVWTRMEYLPTRWHVSRGPSASTSYAVGSW